MISCTYRSGVTRYVNTRSSQCHQEYIFYQLHILSLFSNVFGMRQWKTWKYWKPFNWNSKHNGCDWNHPGCSDNSALHHQQQLTCTEKLSAFADDKKYGAGLRRDFIRSCIFLLWYVQKEIAIWNKENVFGFEVMPDKHKKWCLPWQTNAFVKRVSLPIKIPMAEGEILHGS